MTKEEKNILYALSLGDGSISRDKRSKDKNGGYRFTCSHCEAQKMYSYYKNDILNGIFGTNNMVCEHGQICNFTGKYSKRYSIGATSKYLRFVYSNLYNNGVKIITPNILDKLSYKGIAIWYMDDGSLSKKYSKSGIYSANDMIFHTCCPKTEAQDILDWFKNKFGVSGTLKREKRSYSVRFGTKAARIIISFLEPYALEIFKYKFDVKK